MLFGTWVTTIAGLGYIGVGAITGEAVWSGVPVVVWAFLTLRLLHGMSTGFRPTGTTAFLTDITPSTGGVSAGLPRCGRQCGHGRGTRDRELVDG